MEAEFQVVAHETVEGITKGSMQIQSGSKHDSNCDYSHRRFGNTASDRAGDRTYVTTSSNVNVACARGTDGTTSTIMSKCPYCGNANHRSWQCATFKTMNTDDRWEVVRTAKLCFRCLRGGHTSRRCPAKIGECGRDGCQRLHNRLLHSSSGCERSDTEKPVQEAHAHVT